MDIHVVRPGDTMYRLAQQYGVPMERLIQDNQLPDPSQLVVGQTVVVQYPELTHTVRAGDSLYSIAQMHGTTAAQLLRNNPALQGRDLIYPGQTIVVRYASKPRGSLTANAYAYPSVSRDLLRATLPYLSQLTPFTYRFEGDGLIPLRDEALTNAFPREADADGDGLVYYLLTGEWYNRPRFPEDGSFSQIWGADPVDGAALEEWLSSYTGGAEPLSIPYQPLEEQSISALGVPKPDVTYPEPQG